MRAAAIDTAEFARLVRIGLGRALLHLRDHDPAPYRDVIRHACLRNQVYDVQCEPSREQYLYELMQASGKFDELRGSVLEALHALTDRREAYSLLQLTRLMAQQGHADARAALYALFERSAGRYRLDGAEEIVELDGIGGLLHVAERLPFHTEAGEPYLLGLVDEAAARDGQSAVDAAVARMAKRSEQIAVLRDEVEMTRARRMEWSSAHEKQGKLQRADYSEMRSRLGAHDSMAAAWIVRWGRQATDEDLESAARDYLALLSANQDQWQLAAYWRLFRDQRFPLDPAPFLDRARSSDAVTAGRAQSVLAKLTQPEVRGLGLELLADGDPMGARLLVHNYQDGDFARIAEALLAWQDPEQIHALGWGLRDVVEAQPSAAAAIALVALNERGPCVSCRLATVDWLLELDALPAWMAEECRYDANPDTRELVAKEARGSQAGGPTMGE